MPDANQATVTDARLSGPVPTVTRRQPRRAKLEGVEAGRGIAALLVVMLHASAMLAEPKYFGIMPLGGLFKFAHAGVDFFFVLSGFIILYVHYHDIGHPEKLSSYYWKRFVRIFPAYWIVTAIWGLILVFSPTADRAEQQLGTILTSAFLLPLPQNPILSVAWTLKHELLFYALFGLFIINYRAGVVGMSIWGAFLIANMSVSCVTGAPYFSGLAGGLFFRIFNVEFFFGLSIAYLVLNWKPWHPRVLLLIGILIFFTTGLLESWGPVMRVEWPPRHLGYAVGAALSIYGLTCTELAGHLKIPSCLRVLGTASYAIYLVHPVVVMVLQQVVLRVRRFIPLQLELTFIFFVVTAVVAGVVFSYWIEQPLLRRLRDRRVTPRAAAVAG